MNPSDGSVELTNSDDSDVAPFTIRRAEYSDAGVIAEIYNEAIGSTTATFDTEPQSEETRRHWLESHDDRHPVFVAEVNQRVVGWAALTKWSDRPAYDGTVESAFYVSEGDRGRGIGRALKERLISEARRLGFHTILSRAAQGSDASLHLNEAMGFRHIGTMKEVGLKFGQRLDVHMMQLMLAPEDDSTQIPPSDAAIGEGDGSSVESSQNQATSRTAGNVAILLFDDVEVLDFCGPFEVFSVAGNLTDPPSLNVFTVAENSSIRARNGLTVIPDYTLSNCPRVDVLLVPGGIGSRKEVNNKPLIDWIRTTSKTAGLVLSVCTGALLLGKAGLLDGLGATTHHGAFDVLRETVPTATVHEQRRFVDNGRIITSAGIAAGIDMSLHVVARRLGAEVAAATASHMEYPWQQDEDVAS
ncbi:MAG: GNAT family N-acetyltransferase [Fuerstiella sp.]